MAANTKNSPEYQVLFWLNKWNPRYDIEVENLKSVIDTVTEYQIKEVLEDLEKKKYVDRKKDPDKPHGLTITEEGQKRFSGMTTDVELENVPRKLRDSIDTLSIIGTVIAVIELIFICQQTQYINTQNTLIQQQDSLMQQQLILQYKQFELDFQETHKTDTIHVSSDTVLVRIVKSKK